MNADYEHGNLESAPSLRKTYDDGPPDLLVFVSITLVITYWAARRSSGANAFFAANRQITAWPKGFAVAGDYMSAARSSASPDHSRSRL